MNKLVELIYWLQIFLSPFILLNFLGIYIYLSNKKLLWLSILVGILGCVLGLYFAERIRKRIGTSSFMAKNHHTDDVKTYKEIVQSDRTNN
jgi:hypothetical protein